MDRARLRELDLRHIWHPYTQMADLASSDFPIITEGRGARIRDADGTWYLDGVSSMWLNVHGHRVPELDAALTKQVGRIAHSTLLGQGNDAAIRLAADLVRHAPGLPRVFYSDNGSTAVEAAIKIALQYRVQTGRPKKCRIASFDGAYHGDTMGAIAAAPVPAFHGAFTSFLKEPPIRLPWPDTTRGPHPGDAKATTTWALDEAQRILAAEAETLAAVVVEPMVQFVGGLRVMPAGYLAGLRRITQEHDVHLIVDEVATGFGRTGRMFAVDHEGVVPDLMALGKGLTGGYMPLAATLATDEIYKAFLGDHAAMKAFYHGHSFTGNALGCAVAAASLALLEKMLPALPRRAARFGKLVAPIAEEAYVGEVRHCGFAAGFDLVKDKATMEPFAWQSRPGWAVYEAAKAKGLLARPYASTGLLVPPLGATDEEITAMVAIYHDAVRAARPALAQKATERHRHITEVPT